MHYDIMEQPAFVLPEQRRGWWFGFGRRKREVRRLEQLLALGRENSALREEVGRLTASLARVRDWNTALLKEKEATARAHGEMGRMLDALKTRVDDAAVAFTDAQGRVQYLERELDDTVRSRDEMEEELKRTLARAEAAAQRRKKRGKR